MELITIIFVLVLVIFSLILLAILQIKMAGINVLDFWSFIQANQILDKLYIFSIKYEKLSTQEQIIFLTESEKVFDAFEKVPNMLWEEEFLKYDKVLGAYKDIKMLRWQIG